jgi:hypothetical protein
MSVVGPTEPPARPSDEEQGRVDLRIDQDQYSQTVVARARELKALGFSDEFIENHRSQTLVGANVTVRERLDFLNQQGFKDPITLIEKYPSILGLSPENIQNKLTELRGNGFKDPITLIEKLPSILGLSPENIQNKLTELRGNGFKDPITLIEKAPQILSFSPENIQNKLTELRGNGFKDPITLIEKVPSILNYSPENIQNKLTELRGNGFKDPITLIEKLPSILGLSPENINRRVRLFGKLVEIFDSPIDPVAMMEQETTLFGTKIDKLLVLTRIARNSLHNLGEIDRKLIHDIVFANLEDVMLALEGIGEDQHSIEPKYTIQDILARVKQIKAQKLPKDVKRAEIESAEHIDPKVKQRYFRGYPLNKENL